MMTRIIRAMIGIAISALIVVGSTNQAYAASGSLLTDTDRQSFFSYIAQKPEISAEQAVRIAYNHAGVDKQDVIFPNVEVHIADDKKTYVVSFYVGMIEYCYDIDGSSGMILNNTVNNYNETLT